MKCSVTEKSIAEVSHSRAAEERRLQAGVLGRYRRELASAERRARKEGRGRVRRPGPIGDGQSTTPAELVRNWSSLR